MIDGLSLLLVVSLVLILVPILENGFKSPPSLDFSYPDPDNLSPSDKEFLSRLPPKSDLKIALKVRKIVAESAGVDIDNVWPESRLVEDLWME